MKYNLSSGSNRELDKESGNNHEFSDTPENIAHIGWCLHELFIAFPVWHVLVVSLQKRVFDKSGGLDG